ncbi:DUF6415 family natural product biosynthesis protein [Streptomyces sp. NPDC007095]|uniref:DUF6415 family natural product biosynthesis protein n=1 Tax=Streptomyces sp. NPDC007095 TaxID=3154482 RepID=UPI0033C53017
MGQETGADSVDSLIGEAINAGRCTVPHERFVEIDKALREEIDRLAPLVQRLAGSTAVKHRSREWYACDNALGNADHAQSYQLGYGPTACALHVAELARRIRELRQVLQDVGGVRP